MKLGFLVSEVTVSRYMPRRPADPARVKRWLDFLHNHKDVIAAMDLFTVPTVSLRVLYVLFTSSIMTDDVSFISMSHPIPLRPG